MSIREVPQLRRWQVEVIVRDGVELIRVCQYGYLLAEVSTVEDLAELGVELASSMRH